MKVALVFAALVLLVVSYMWLLTCRPIWALALSVGFIAFWVLRLLWEIADDLMN